MSKDDPLLAINGGSPAKTTDYSTGKRYLDNEANNLGNDNINTLANYEHDPISTYKSCLNEDKSRLDLNQNDINRRQEMAHE
ncbi:MAG: hypothetical protein HRT89_01735 [Lentisphaeria bacterium]|nr:hypothetical protein [Lentisphaeria bacterium]NQZ66768.1 hypothetical protein [Lentisphaeria bacterium]